MSGLDVVGLMSEQFFKNNLSRKPRALPLYYTKESSTVKPAQIHNYTEIFEDMPSDKKLAFLQYIHLKELYFDDSVKNWLRNALRTEQADPVRAMMLEAMTVYIDESEIRHELETILNGLHPPESPLTYSAAKEILITALTDDMKAVKEWGTRVLETYENVTPKNETSLCSFLANHLKDENQPPRLRWHTALGLAHLGTPAAIENLIDFGRNLTQAPQSVPEQDLNHDINIFLMEKLAYSLGSAADKIAVRQKKTQVLELLKQINQRIHDEGQESKLTAWALSRVESVKSEPETQLWGDRISGFWRRIQEMVQVSLFPKIFVAAIAVCVILFFIIPSGQIAVNITVIGNAGKPSIRTKGTVPVPTKEEFELKEGCVLNSGDYFRIKIKTDNDAYVYMFFYDSSGEISEPFFYEVRAGETLVLPDEKERFRLDAYTGTETVFVLASENAIDGFEKKLEELRNAGISEIKKIFPEAAVQSFSFEHQ
jgi:hypothetical protein